MAPGIANAQNLGVYGKTYLILEKDGVAQLKAAVSAKLANGGKEAMLKGAKDRYLDSLNHIKTPDGIVLASANVTKFVDLTLTVPEDIKDPTGRLIVAAGTKINPLEINPLSKDLYFIDASDQRQLDLVKQKATENDKVILLGGSFFDAQDYLKRRVYLDVPGLHTKMKILKLPSIASQKGFMLQVQEIKL